MDNELAQQAAYLLTSDQRAMLRKAFGKSCTRERANQAIASLTGLTSFFESDDLWVEFREALASEVAGSIQESGREYGDFQTPFSLAKAVCHELLNLGYNPSVLIEPS